MTEPNDISQLSASERLERVALLLKQADKLVKEGDLSSALELIVKARTYNSNHLYALAYEERVRALISAQQKEQREKKSTSSTTSQEKQEPSAEQKIIPTLQHLSNLAIMEAQHSATVATQQEKVTELRKKEEEEKSKQEELRRKAIETKIATFLDRATSYAQRKEYNRALDEIARAYLLDPVNERIHACETRVRKLLEENARQEELERARKQEEERLKREELLKRQSVLVQKEKEEKFKKQEEERKLAQQEKVRQYLQHVKELYQANKFDEALSELAFVVVIDPLNEEVLRLEQDILQAQEQQQQAQLALYQRQIEERRKKQEAIRATIKKHIENAELLARQKKFTEALRTITRATVLDPNNEELQQCENRVLVMQEEFIRSEEEKKRALQEQIKRQQEEEIMRLEQVERNRQLQEEQRESNAKIQADKEKISHYLTRAQQYLREKNFDVALGEVALAFIVNPFDEDIKKIEQEILTAREAHLSRQNDTLHQSLQDELKKNEDVAAKIAFHLQEAERFRREQQYSKAFNEVAQAFILDPLNVEVQEYEQAIQAEFDRYLAEQRKKREKDEKASLLERHIEHAQKFIEHKMYDEALAEVVAGLVIDEQNKELLALKQTIITNTQRQYKQREQEAQNIEIQKLLVTARELLTVGKLEEAKSAIAKALQLDPRHAEALSIQADIDAVQMQMSHTKQQEEKSRRIHTHLVQAQSFIMGNMLDKALGEILLGLSLDPTHEELLKLEQRVIMLYEAHNDSSQHSSLPEHKPMLEEEKKRLVSIHVRVANEFRMQKEFSKALDEIAQGLLVDPLNEELLYLDNQIRQEQSEYDQKAAEGLKLIYTSGKAAG